MIPFVKLYCFVCDVFNNAVSNSDYVASIVWATLSEWWIGNYFGI